MASKRISLLAITFLAAGSMFVSPTAAGASCRALPKSLGVEVGDSTSYAWNKSGIAYAWGRGDWGQRGDGSSSYDKNKPQRVEVVKNVYKISSFGSHALFLQRDGNVFATGYNKSGQLGTGDKRYRKTPTKVRGISCAVDIAASGDASFALRADGTVWAWGYNADGELNIGNQWPALKPKRVQGLVGVISLEAGEDNLFATTSSGSIKVLGYNHDGQLGIGNEEDPDNFPVEVLNLRNPKSLSAAFDTVAAVDGKGEIFIWGSGHRAMPIGLWGEATTPTALSLGGNWNALALGHNHALAIDGESTLWIWGSNRNGASGLGLGTYCLSFQAFKDGCDHWDFATDLYYKSVDKPVRLLSGVKTFAAGDDFSVAVLKTGAVYAWGNGDDGQLGNGYSFDNDKPSQVYMLNLNR